MYTTLFKNKLFSIAPMFKKTDKYCNYLHRKLTKKSLIYTEMIHTNTSVNKKKLLFNNKKINFLHPIAIQLAGNKPVNFAKYAKKIKHFGYSEININIGCPSKVAQNSQFGACLMKNPNIINKIIKKIQKITDIPISIKTRIGIDNLDSYDFLYKFIKKISFHNNCKKFILHARKANLRNFNTKKNRTVPAIKYHYVYRIKQDFPNLNIVINGEIKKIKEIKNHLKFVDGVMLGREVCKNPYFLGKIDKKIFKEKKIICPIKTTYDLLPKIFKTMKKEKTPINKFLQHIKNLFYKKKKEKKWKFFLNKIIKKKTNLNYSPKIILKYIKKIEFFQNI